jgi:hypothetical protein
MRLDKMEKEAFEKVNQAVYKQFPYLQGVEPEIAALENDQFLLIYKGQATTADGHALPILLRAVSDKEGNRIRFTSSR